MYLDDTPLGGVRVQAMPLMAYSHAGQLIFRAADVMLIEKRHLVLMLHKTPLHYGHIKNMLRVIQMGAIVTPPAPALLCTAFFSNPPVG